MSFTCPTCKVPLEARTSKDSRSWECVSCKGFAMSLPLVRRNISREAFKKIWRKLSLEETGTGRACPGCRNPLRVLEAEGKTHGVMIDVCRTCQLLWFDESEFTALPKAEAENSRNKELSPEANRALIALKEDLLNRRSRLLGLKEFNVSEEPELDEFLDFLLQKVGFGGK